MAFRRLITNSSDRVLRQFLLPIYPAPSENGAYVEQDLEPTHRFSDPITRTAWHATSFSPDGEWLAGGAADPSGHKIYIWDLSNDGQFVTALDGGKEPLVHVHVSQLAPTGPLFFVSSVNALSGIPINRALRRLLTKAIF